MATIIGYRPKDPSKALFQIADESWAVLVRFILDRCQNLLPPVNLKVGYGTTKTNDT